MRFDRLPYLLLLVSLALGVTSCSRGLTTLTKSVKTENGWSDEELSRIQFYLSENLVLSRERSAGSTTIAEGMVRVKDGRNVEEIVFERGTPGVVLFDTETDQLAIGFDSRRDDRFLMFGPNPKRGDQYTLLAKEWNRYTGKVTYDKKEWEVTAAAADVTLLFRLRRTGSTKRKVQNVGGRRL